MLTLTLVSLILFFISVAWLRSVVVQRRFSARRQAGLLVIRQLFQLLESIPQHRGMSNALLKGNSAFKEKCYAHQKKIGRQLQKISNDYPEFSSSPGYLEVKKGWHKVTENFSSLSAEESFSLHTAIISKLLNLISDTGSLSKLDNSDDKQLHGLLEIGINILPFVTEVLGQARGIGTGAATQARLNTQSRSKLGYLHQKASLVCDETITILRHQKIDKNMLDFTQCQKSIALFLSTLDREFLSAKKIMIKPDHYFAIASDAIGLSFKQLNSLMKQLSNTLEKEYDNQYKTLYISLFSTFLSTLLVVEMFILQLAE
ncbi:MAG: hypothetical protein L3J94_01195 [Gammaproteobacteria bacterium]|nr:hypothetical protein [Gammaproteobacteria bacterium]